jgi:hypothetical protein
MTISHQFSTSILNAQSGQKIDAYIKQFLLELSAYQLPEPLKKTGLSVEKSDDGLLVKAHGITLRSKTDHVWDMKGILIGRIQFVQIDDDESKKESSYSIFIDSFGNMGHGELAHHFSSKFTGTDVAEIIETLRRVVTGLLNAIHDLIPKVNV